MKNSSLLILYLIIPAVFFSSCKQRIKNNDTAVDEVQRRIGSILILPENNGLYNIEEDSTLYKQNVFESEVKIVSFINGNCSACISDLKKWELFLRKNSSCNRITTIFYVHADDFATFKHIYDTYINSSIPMFLDSNNMFFRKNELSEDKMLQTFLVDKEGKILLVGNPLFSNELKNLYIIEIQKRLK